MAENNVLSKKDIKMQNKLKRLHKSLDLGANYTIPIIEGGRCLRSRTRTPKSPEKSSKPPVQRANSTGRGSKAEKKTYKSRNDTDCRSPPGRRCRIQNDNNKSQKDADCRSPSGRLCRTLNDSDCMSPPPKRIYSQPIKIEKLEKNSVGNSRNKKSDFSKLVTSKLPEANFSNKKNDKTIANNNGVIENVTELKNNMKTSGIVIKRKLDLEEPDNNLDVKNKLRNTTGNARKIPNPSGNAKKDSRTQTPNIQNMIGPGTSTYQGIKRQKLFEKVNQHVPVTLTCIPAYKPCQAVVPSIMNLQKRQDKQANLHQTEIAESRVLQKMKEARIVVSNCSNKNDVLEAEAKPPPAIKDSTEAKNFVIDKGDPVIPLTESIDESFESRIIPMFKSPRNESIHYEELIIQEDYDEDLEIHKTLETGDSPNIQSECVTKNNASVDISDTKMKIKQNSCKVIKSNCQIKRSKESEKQEMLKQNKVTNLTGYKEDKIVTQFVSKNTNILDWNTKKNIQSINKAVNLNKMELKDQMHKKNNYNYQAKIMNQPKVPPYKPRNSFALIQKQVNISKDIINLRDASVNKGLQEPGNLFKANPRIVLPTNMDVQKKKVEQKLNTSQDNDMSYTDNSNNGQESKSITSGNRSKVVKEPDTENINMCKIEDKHASQENKTMTSNSEMDDPGFELPNWYSGSARSHVNSDNASKNNELIKVDMDNEVKSFVIQKNCIDKLIPRHNLANELETKATYIPELIENKSMSSDDSVNEAKVFNSIETSEASINELDNFANELKVSFIKSNSVTIDTSGNSLKIVDCPNSPIKLDLNSSGILEVTCTKEIIIDKEHIMDTLAIPKVTDDESILINKNSIDNLPDGNDIIKVSSDETMMDNCTNDNQVFNLKSIDILKDSDDNTMTTDNCTNETKVTNLNLIEDPDVPEIESMPIYDCVDLTDIFGQKSIAGDNPKTEIEALSSNTMHIENDTVEPEELLDIVVSADEKYSENSNDERNDLGLNNKNTITNSDENVILDEIDKSTTNDSLLTVAADINSNIKFSVSPSNNIDIIPLDSSSTTPNEKSIITNEKSKQSICNTEENKQDELEPADQINNIVEDLDDHFGINGKFIFDWTSALNDNVLPDSPSPEKSIDMPALNNELSELQSFEKIINPSEDKIINEELNAFAINDILDINGSNSIEDSNLENISVRKSIQESESEKENMDRYVVGNNFDSREEIFSENYSGDVLSSLSEDIKINDGSSSTNSVEHSLNIIPNSTFTDIISNVSDLYLHESELSNPPYGNDIETTTCRKAEIPVDVPLIGNDVPVDLSIKKKEYESTEDQIEEVNFLSDNMWNSKFDEHLEQVLFEPQRLSADSEKMLKEFEELYLATIAVLPGNNNSDNGNTDGGFQQQEESTIDIKNNISDDNVDESGINNMINIQLADILQNQLYNDISLNDYIDVDVTNDFSVDVLLDNSHHENTQPATLSQIEKDISLDGDIIMNSSKLPPEPVDIVINNNNNEIGTELEANKETEIDNLTEFESFVQKNVFGNPDLEFLDLLSQTLDRFRFNKNSATQGTQEVFSMPEHDNETNNTAPTTNNNIPSQQFLKQSADIASKRRFYSQQINYSQSRHSSAYEKSFSSQSSFSKNDSWDKRKFEGSNNDEPGSPSRSCSQALSRILREPRLPNILRKRRPIVKNASQQPFNNQIGTPGAVRICSQPVGIVSRTEGNTTDMHQYYSQQTAGPRNSGQTNLNMITPDIVQVQNVFFSQPNLIPPKKQNKHKKNKAKRNKNSSEKNSEKKKNIDAIRTRTSYSQPSTSYSQPGTSSNYYANGENSYQNSTQIDERTFNVNNYVSNQITLTPNHDVINECNLRSDNSPFMGASNIAPINNTLAAPSNLNTDDFEMSCLEVRLSDMEAHELLGKYYTTMG